MEGGAYVFAMPNVQRLFRRRCMTFFLMLTRFFFSGNIHNEINLSNVSAIMRPCKFACAECIISLYIQQPEIEDH